jgi:hypothetical protein
VLASKQDDALIVGFDRQRPDVVDQITPWTGDDILRRRAARAADDEGGSARDDEGDQGPAEEPSADPRLRMSAKQAPMSRNHAALSIRRVKR